MILIRNREKVEGADLEQKVDVVKKLRKIIVHIRGSDSRTKEFKQICEFDQVKPRKLPLDAPTRWSSTYIMIETALVYYKQIHKYCSHQNIKRIKNTEWKQLVSVKKVLKEFAEASDLAQSEIVPTIYLSIPMFNTLFDQLDTLIEKKQFVGAALRARKKLKKYYALTDECYCHYVSAILNPCTKMEYFKENGWDEDVLEEIIDLFFVLFSIF